MPNSLILHAQGTGDGVPLPLVLAGHPAEIEGRRCHYRRKEIISDGDWVHRGHGTQFSINPTRTQLWQENFGRRVAAGIRTPILKRHTEIPNADDVLGYVIGIERKGEKVFADMQFVGDDSLALAAVNDVSIYEKAEGRDAKGNIHGMFLDHVALTPNPNQPHLGPFVTIAASAGGSAVDVPIYEPATAFTKELPMLKPETLTALRTKLGSKPEATDAEVAEQAAALALSPPADPQVVALSANVATLTTERDTARAEAATLNGKVLALSAATPSDPMLVSLMGDQLDARCEAALEAGAPKAFVDTVAGLLKTNDGKPNTLALSACALPVADGKVKQSMFGMAVMDTVAKLYKGGFGKGVEPGHVQAASVLALTGASTDTESTPARMNELRQYAQIPAK